MPLETVSRPRSVWTSVDLETLTPAGKPCAVTSPRSVCFQDGMTLKVQAQSHWAGLPALRPLPQGAQGFSLGLCTGGPSGCEGFPLLKVDIVCQMLSFPFISIILTYWFLNQIWHIVPCLQETTSPDYQGGRST